MAKLAETGEMIKRKYEEAERKLAENNGNVIGSSNVEKSKK